MQCQPTGSMSWKDCHETNNHSTYLPTDSSVHTCAGGICLYFHCLCSNYFNIRCRKGSGRLHLIFSVSMGLGGYQQNWWLMTLVSYGVGMSVLTRILTNLNIHFTDSLQRRIIQALQSLTIGEERCKSSFGTRGIIIRWCLVFGRMATSCSKSSQRAMFFVFSVRAAL